MNRMVLSLALVAMSTGFAMIGCGTDTTGGSTTGSTGGGYTPPASIPIEDASLEFSKALCTKFFSCCDASELAEFVSKFNPKPQTVTECVAVLEPAVENESFAYVATRVKDGAIAYDQSKAGACFAAIANDCAPFEDNYIEAIPACNGFLKGLVAAGGECYTEGECAEAGSICVGSSAGGGAGVCGPIPKENEQCPDFECASGLVCFSDGMGNTCQKPLADGTMCGFSGDCASQYCDFAVMACAPKKANGEACADYDACKDGFCDMTAMKCTAKKADGEACTSYDECMSDNCSEAGKCSGPQCDGM